MKSFFTLLKWQARLLYRNNVINISLAVTFIYMSMIFVLRDIEHMDKVVIAIILNDPAIIGYFFIALSIYGERKNNTISAITTSPVSIHQFLLTRVIVLSLIGTLCSLLLIVPIQGLDFNVWAFINATFGICFIACCLGLIMQTFADEFLKFALISVPIFIIGFGVPLLHYLNGIDLGGFKYAFFIQGAVEMLDYAISNVAYNPIYSYISLLIFSVVLFKIAHHLFILKVIRK